VARSIDTQQAHLIGVLKRAHAHTGASFVEILQNCVVFNDAVFDHITGKKSPRSTDPRRARQAAGLRQDQGQGTAAEAGKIELEIAPAGADTLVHDETSRPSRSCSPRWSRRSRRRWGCCTATRPNPTSMMSMLSRELQLAKVIWDALLNSERTWEVS
jgi:hypothetical protein